MTKKKPVPSIPISTGIEMLYGRLKSIEATHGMLVAEKFLEWMMKELPDVAGTSAKMKELNMRKTYGIEIKADFEDPAREKMMKKLMRQSCRQILAKANLLADNGRPAQAACRTDDWFEGGTLEELGAVDADDDQAEETKT